jgi:hypothetical protein
LVGIYSGSLKFGANGSPCRIFLISGLAASRLDTAGGWLCGGGRRARRERYWRMSGEVAGGIGVDDGLEGEIGGKVVADHVVREVIEHSAE